MWSSGVASIAVNGESRPMQINSGNGVRFRRPMRGFTLIELMIVVAVVAILASIAYPSYQEQIRKSRRAQAKADLVELTHILERYRTVNNTYVGVDATGAFFDQSPRDRAPYYTLAISNETASAFTLTATPVEGGSQASDRCGALSINQAGVKGETGSASYEDCW